MTSFGASPEEGGLQALFETSTDPGVHVSAAAETAFLFALAALVAAPFSVMRAVSLLLGGLAVLFGLVGMATTSRPYVAGRALVPAALVFAFTALAIVGLRYLGLDTAFGDGLLPTVSAWLGDLNASIPQP